MYAGSGRNANDVKLDIDDVGKCVMSSAHIREYYPSTRPLRRVLGTSRLLDCVSGLMQACNPTCHPSMSPCDRLKPPDSCVENTVIQRKSNMQIESFLSKTHGLFYRQRQFCLQRLQCLIRWQVKSVEAKDVRVYINLGVKNEHTMCVTWEDCSILLAFQS